MGALPIGALPTTGVGGGGCRVGKSAAIATPATANMHTTTHIKCFMTVIPLIQRLRYEQSIDGLNSAKKRNFFVG
jgi:hypothetical protein